MECELFAPTESDVPSPPLRPEWRLGYTPPPHSQTQPRPNRFR